MNVLDCLALLQAELLNRADLSAPIVDVVVSDLMSDVLLTHREDFLLVTSLTSDQVVRTADIVGARAILVTNNKRPQPAMLSLAETHSIPVLRTGLDTFSACRRLVKCLDCAGKDQS